MIFERRVWEILKKLPDFAKREETYSIYRRSALEKTTFEDNLNEYLKKVFPNAASSDRFD